METYNPVRNNGRYIYTERHTTHPDREQILVCTTAPMSEALEGSRVSRKQSESVLASFSKSCKGNVGVQKFFLGRAMH